MGDIFAAGIVAAVFAVPVVLIMRWSNHRKSEAERRHREREAERVLALAAEQRGSEQRLEESLKAGSLFQTADQKKQ